MYSVHVYCVLCILFPPAAEICARWASNYGQQLTTVKSGANDLVWQTVCYFTDSWHGGRERESWANSSPFHYTTWQVGGVVFPPLAQELVIQPSRMLSQIFI